MVYRCRNCGHYKPYKKWIFILRKGRCVIGMGESFIVKSSFRTVSSWYCEKHHNK